MPLPEDHASQLSDCLAQLVAGNACARDTLIAIAYDRLQALAHRMLRGFPVVRRWGDTDDVVQDAAMRLVRSLGEVTPQSPREFIGLAALQIRRTLLDLGKKHAGPESYAANHGTNVVGTADRARPIVDEVAGPTDSPDVLERWTRFHEVGESLPPEERELFQLVWYLGLKQREAATVLGCSERTVRRRWESLRSSIAAAMAGEPPM